MSENIVSILVAIAAFIIYLLLVTFFTRALGARRGNLWRVAVATLLGAGAMIGLFYGVQFLIPETFENLLPALSNPLMLMMFAGKMLIVMYALFALSFLIFVILLQYLVDLSFWRSVASVFSANAILMHLMFLLSIGSTYLGVGVSENEEQLSNFEGEVLSVDGEPTTADEFEEQMTNSFTAMAALMQCIENLDQEELKAMELETVKRQAMLDTYCEANERDEAQKEALEYSEEVYNSSALQGVLACTEQHSPGASRMRVPTVEQLQLIHICDYVEDNDDFD